MSAIFVYITNPSKKEALRVAKHLLKKKLIACAIIHGPIRSLYHWRKKLIDESEYVLLGKTLAANFEKIRKEVEKIHSYDTPFIAKIPIEINKKYFDWLKGEII